MARYCSIARWNRLLILDETGYIRTTDVMFLYSYKFYGYNFNLCPIYQIMQVHPRYKVVKL